MRISQKDDHAFNERLGRQIAVYWAKLGFKVSFIVQPVGGGGPCAGAHCLETDMRNGLPTATLGAGR